MAAAIRPSGAEAHNSRAGLNAGLKACSTQADSGFQACISAVQEKLGFGR